MAKIKQPTEDNITASAESPISEPKEIRPTSQPAKSAAPKIEQAPDAAPEAPDAFILEILKAFPTYKTLYVDHQGGTYTPDTAPVIRGNAVLYHNPFHKS